jgi:hypothetical protein
MGAAEEEPVAPVFDDSRKALVFALNANRVAMPRPFMNKAMAEAPRKAPKKRRKSALALFLAPDDAFALLELENAPKRRGSRPPGPQPLKGLDRAHQAGFILSQLDRIYPAQRLVLRGLLTQAYEPCTCRSPCCSGRRRNARWAEAVKATCLLLKEVGDVTREPGKRGLSTQPEMRLALVEQFYTKNTMTVADAARIGKVSTMTATRHRDWIFEFLEQTETEAWLSIDALFDQVGITGSFT